MSIDNFDIFAWYRDLWKTKSEKRNATRQGMISIDGFTENCMKLRISASDKSTSKSRDKSIGGTHRNKFVIPFDFEMLDSAMPYYQTALRNRLCYELTMNDYNQVIISTGASPDARYKTTEYNLYLYFITQPDLAKHIPDECQSMALLYDRVLRHRQITVNKSDKAWNWSFNTPCRSLKRYLASV